MRVWIDALATTNQSGRHVLLGHLQGLVALGRSDLSFTVLYPAGCSGLPVDLGSTVVWCACPASTRQWYWRHVWERWSLPGRVTPEVADVVLVMSGTSLRGISVPQVSLAMNPWALVPGVERSLAERMKAFLQRHAYRRAVREADAMVYLSGYLRDAYCQNAGMQARQAAVVYASVGSDVRASADRLAGEPRQPGRSVCVSAMAAHKGIETLVEALDLLRTRHGRQGHLDLVGAWPDSSYEHKIRLQVARLGLQAQVNFRGHLPRTELLECCARAEVFAILSRCESFGIPGVEAQALGTPVVCSDAGAMPEVYGRGAIVVPVGDASAAAGALAQVLGDASVRARLSDVARANARRFCQIDASRVLLEFLETVAHSEARTL
jgi:glycosyltransferase involved in cell wall biosynthesis